MTKTLDDYMNDPALAGEMDALREIHAVRLMIHDETKNMTAEEKRAYFHNGTMDCFARLGVTPKYANFSTLKTVTQ
ncbi:MAG: hypothetical protein LBT39_04170 [Treponema sp.]|jgi:hypothetical protein|nr:hypothetical protein [Treponema sp.]